MGYILALYQRQCNNQELMLSVHMLVVTVVAKQSYYTGMQKYIRQMYDNLTSLEIAVNICIVTLSWSHGLYHH